MPACTSGGQHQFVVNIKQLHFYTACSSHLLPSASISMPGKVSEKCFPTWLYLLLFSERMAQVT